MLEDHPVVADDGRLDQGLSSEALAGDPGHETRGLVDHWEYSKDTWIRHHLVPRAKLFDPAEAMKGGPLHESLEPTRITSTKFTSGDTLHHEDNWQSPLVKSNIFVYDQKA